MTTGNEYMRASRPGVQPPSAQSLGVPYPPLELPIPEGVRMIALPKPKDFPLHNLDFKELIEKRRTLRKYTEEAISLQELAFFLATHDFDARPEDGYVTVKIDNLVYKVTPNKDRPGLADIAVIN